MQKKENKNAPANATEEEKYTKEPYKTAYYTYDYLGRMTSYKSPNGYVTSYTYNPEGWLTQELTPYNGSSKGKVVYTYDMLGNKTAEKVSTTGSSVRATGYVYDSRGNLTRMYTRVMTGQSMSMTLPEI